VILAAMIAAASVVAVDVVRQRRAAATRIDVWSSLSRAVSGSVVTDDRTSVTATIGESLVTPATAPEGSLGGVWDEVAGRLDLDGFRPTLAAATEVVVFEVRGGDDYGVIARPDRTVHYYLEPWEAQLLELMDGSRTTQELIVERLELDGSLDPGAILALIVSLYEGGFLDPAPIDVPGLITDRLDRASPGRRKVSGFLRDLKIGWDGADRLVKACYRWGLRYAFRPAVFALLAAIAVAGLLAFWSVASSDRFSLDARSAPIEAVLLIALGFVLTFAHELGHALVMTHNGRYIISAGFFIFFGSPAFFVDSSDGLMLGRTQRITQSFAGPFAELVLAGFASIALFLWPDSGAAGFWYRFSVLNYFIIFLNLIPLLELDGYWILSDVLQVRNLRPRSLAFVQSDLVPKLARRERFTRQEVGLALYGTIGAIFTVFSLWSALFFWREIFGDLVTSLWNGGTGSRLILIVLVLFFAGPAIRGAISLAKAAVRRLQAVAARIRFRFERSWRIEAATMIDSLPGFDDLPEDLLSDLAGRVTLRTLPPGHTLFRAGDRSDAFYVVRRGHVNVEDVDPATGDTRVLRTLGPGDPFGELGLLDRARRKTTIRAVDRAQVFRVDQATFDRLLADATEAPTFAPTMQSLAEVRGLPAFRRLALDEVQELLEHGGWVSVAPGEAILEQGEVGDAFYAIGSGKADVVRDGELVAVLGPGDHFGEVALLEHVPRNATVLARTPMRVFRLDTAGFDAFVARSMRGDRPDRGRGREQEH
jgi:CRP-like cAMP-binding protein/Zn-dependent protease